MQSTKPLLFDPYSSHPQPGPNAHTADADFLPRPAQFVQQGRNLPGPGTAKWVTERNGAAIGVDLRKTLAYDIFSRNCSPCLLHIQP